MSRKKILGLKSKKVGGMVKILKTVLYEDHMIYIRSIYGMMFEYLVTHNNEIYSSFIVINPREGQTKLSKSEIHEAANLIMTGAMATVDFLIGKELTPEEKAQAEKFIEAGKQIDQAGVKVTIPVVEEGNGKKG